MSSSTAKTTVIHHSGDYDGIFCREIAKKFLGEEGVEYIGWNFGDPLIPFPKDGTVYVLDLSPDCLLFALPDCMARLIWIDHHKTSIEKWTPHFCNADIPGYRIDGVAACRLAWQWFQWFANTPSNPEEEGFSLPTKCNFVERRVTEPHSVRLAGEYDIWDKRDPDAETFQYGLRTVDEGADFWEALLRVDEVGEKAVEEILEHGHTCQKYANKIDASICKALTWLMEWEGLKFLCVNHARFNSLLFAARDVPETGHDALLGFRFDGKQWMVSLYHAAHRKDIDLSEIAKKHGGGGHRGAAGFVCAELPFKL